MTYFCVTNTISSRLRMGDLKSLMVDMNCKISHIISNSHLTKTEYGVLIWISTYQIKTHKLFFTTAVKTYILVLNLEEVLEEKLELKTIFSILVWQDINKISTFSFQWTVKLAKLRFFTMASLLLSILSRIGGAMISISCFGI